MFHPRNVVLSLLAGLALLGVTCAPDEQVGSKPIVSTPDEIAKGSAKASVPLDPNDAKRYVDRVRPFLTRHCVACHEGK